MGTPVKFVITLYYHELYSPRIGRVLTGCYQHLVSRLSMWPSANSCCEGVQGSILSADWLWSHAATVPLARSLTHQSMTNF